MTADEKKKKTETLEHFCFIPHFFFAMLILYQREREREKITATCNKCYMHTENINCLGNIVCVIVEGVHLNIAILGYNNNAPNVYMAAINENCEHWGWEHRDFFSYIFFFIFITQPHISFHFCTAQKANVVKKETRHCKLVIGTRQRPI